MKKTFTIIALLVWPLYLNDLYLIALGNTRLGLLWTLDVVFFMLIPVATLVWLFKSEIISLQEIGLALPPKIVSILAGFGLCALLIVLFEWNLHPWIESLLPWKLFSGYDFPKQQPLRGFVIAYAVVSAGFLEEIMFRGVVISQLMKNGKSAVFAVVISCLIFAGAHWGEGFGKLVWTALWGIAPAIWFVRSKNLWGPITCHTTYLFLIYMRMV